MTATGALLDRLHDHRFDIRAELLAHNIHAVSYGKPECDCHQCDLLRPLPALLHEAIDGLSVRHVLAAVA